MELAWVCPVRQLGSISCVRARFLLSSRRPACDLLASVWQLGSRCRSLYHGVKVSSWCCRQAQRWKHRLHAVCCLQQRPVPCLRLGFVSGFQFDQLTGNLCCSHIVLELCLSIKRTQMCTLQETDGRKLVKIRQYLFFCLKVCDSHNTNESQKHYLNNRSQIQTYANGTAVSGDVCSRVFLG